MTYVILDSSANLVDSFDREEEAYEALREIVRLDPDSAEEYVLIAYADDTGLPVGDPVIGSEVAIHA